MRTPKTRGADTVKTDADGPVSCDSTAPPITHKFMGDASELNIGCLVLSSVLRRYPSRPGSQARPKISTPLVGLAGPLSFLPTFGGNDVLEVGLSIPDSWDQRFSLGAHLGARAA